MNKQEAIEKIEKLEGLTIKNIDLKFDIEMVSKGDVLEIIEQINEPEKPIVPQYVADWYEWIKDNFYGNLECRAWNKFELLAENNNCIPEKPLADDFTRWYYNTENAIQILVNMHQFGYEVEKEKLYTVEIPNPNGNKYNKTYLGKYSNGKVELYNWTGYTSIEFTDNWKQEENAQLSEAEIKEDFDWAWQFAKEVEE